MSGPVIPSLAGTIIVAREEDGGSVLMLRRRPELRFMGGYWVFPGGAADAAESAAAADAIAASAAAACRELQEEAGLHLQPRDLVRWAHWITPSTMSRRFDTHFFLARAPADQQPTVDLAEASEMRWVKPADHAYVTPPSTGFPITAPTQLVLREIAQAFELASSLQQLLDDAGRRPILTVVPKMLGDDEVVFPWDPQYAAIEGEGLNWNAAHCATRADWPSRLPAHVAHPMPKPRRP